jgi:Zn-dependent protease
MVGAMLAESTAPATLDVFDRALAELRSAPPVPREQRPTTIAMSLLLAVLLNQLPDFFSGLVAVLVVLALHELGHYLTMLAFGYRAVDVLFIPVPAAASREAEALSRTWRHVVVLLLGPAPGLLAALALAILHPGSDRMPQHGLVAQLLVASAVINGLNLLPFMPLDGGKVARILFFPNLPSVQTRLAAITSLFVVGFALLAHRWDIAIVAGIWLLFSIAIGVPARIAQKLRQRHRDEFSRAPEHARDAPEELLRVAFDEYQAERARGLQNSEPAALALTLRTTYASAATPALSMGPRVALGVAYLGMTLPCAFLLIDTLVDLISKR